MYPQSGSDSVFPLSQGSSERLPIRPPRLQLFTTGASADAGRPAEPARRDLLPRPIGFGSAANFSGASARSPQ
jgi:hypothetical protein